MADVKTFNFAESCSKPNRDGGVGFHIDGALTAAALRHLAGMIDAKEIVPQEIVDTTHALEGDFTMHKVVVSLEYAMRRPADG